MDSLERRIGWVERRLGWSAIGPITALALVALISACSDDSEQSLLAAEEPKVSAPVSTVDTDTTMPSPTLTVSQVEDSLVDLDVEIAGDGTSWRLLALGGIEFVVPAGHRVHHDGDMVLIRPSWEPDEGRYLPSAVIALVSQIGSTGEFPTVESLTSDAITGVGSATRAGTRIELLGHELTGYRFEADPGAAIGPHYLFPAIPRPGFGPSNWQPFPIATLYLADTPGGVLAVGAIGETEADLETATSIFEQVAPTVELDDLRSRPVNPPNHPAPGEPPAPVAVPAGAPQLLDGLVQPVDAGRYTLDKLASPVGVTVPDGWWVQGNFPGLVVLTGDESFGPGDRSVTFHTGLDQFVSVSSDYEAVGEPLPLSADAPWPTDRFPTLLVGPEIEVDLGGLTARRFDVRVDPDANCSEQEPCEFHLLSAHFPLSETLRKGYGYRIWQLHDGVTEPITIIATASDESWFSEAETVVSSLRFEL